VCDRLEENPIPSNQRLIHRGKICVDSSTLGSILNNNGTKPPHSFHLVLSNPGGGSTTNLKRAMSEPVKSSPSESNESVKLNEVCNFTIFVTTSIIHVLLCA
jgi:hypothetical protein